MPASYLTLLLMLLALGLLVGTIIVFAMAMSLVRPPRMSDGKAVWLMKRLSPGDLQLDFEDVYFNVRDELTGKVVRIAGWWMPNRAGEGRCVVLLHGYADAKVGAIAWAPVWHRLGYNVLAIDLRAHGDSGGIYCTAGFHERHDVTQALDQLCADRPRETRHLVLFGVSLGAATALAAAALRDDLAGIVLESPPADFRNTAITHMDRLGAPGKPFPKLAISLAQRLAHCDFSAVRPVDLVRQIHCPIMMISPDADPMVSEADRALMRDALQSRQRAGDVYWSVTAAHLLALQAEPAAYEKHLGSFLRSLRQDGVG